MRVFLRANSTHQERCCVRTHFCDNCFGFSFLNHGYRVLCNVEHTILSEGSRSDILENTLFFRYSATPSHFEKNKQKKLERRDAKRNPSHRCAVSTLVTVLGTIDTLRACSIFYLEARSVASLRQRLQSVTGGSTLSEYVDFLPTGDKVYGARHEYIAAGKQACTGSLVSILYTAVSQEMPSQRAT